MAVLKITALEFEERLSALCLGGTGSPFPRRHRDRYILYRSMMRFFEPAKTYSEGNLNAVLQQWLSDIGGSLDIDHVTLRRYLVDEGYLFRDTKGSAYGVNPSGHSRVEFETEVAEIDPLAVIRAARTKMAERKKVQSLRFKG